MIHKIKRKLYKNNLVRYLYFILLSLKRSTKKLKMPNLKDKIAIVTGSGRGIGRAKVKNITEEEIDKTFDVNCKGLFLMSKECLPALEKNSGVIINVSSVAGKKGYSEMSVYCASKFAVIGFTEAL